MVVGWDSSAESVGSGDQWRFFGDEAGGSVLDASIFWKNFECDLFWDGEGWMDAMGLATVSFLIVFFYCTASYLGTLDVNPIFLPLDLNQNKIHTEVEIWRETLSFT